jgi:hypothetical protein
VNQAALGQAADNASYSVNGFVGRVMAIADRRMDLFLRKKKTGASRVESAKANDSEAVAFEYPVQE